MTWELLIKITFWGVLFGIVVWVTLQRNPALLTRVRAFFGGGALQFPRHTLSGAFLFIGWATLVVAWAHLDPEWWRTIWEEKRSYFYAAVAIAVVAWTIWTTSGGHTWRRVFAVTVAVAAFLVALKVNERAEEPSPVPVAKAEDYILFATMTGDMEEFLCGFEELPEPGPGTRYAARVRMEDNKLRVNWNHGWVPENRGLYPIIGEAVLTRESESGLFDGWFVQNTMNQFNGELRGEISLQCTWEHEAPSLSCVGRREVNGVCGSVVLRPNR